MNIATMKLPDSEYLQRLEQLTNQIRLDKLTGIVLFDRYYILYYTGFAFIPTERPVALVVNTAGERALFVPRLELEHAESNAFVDQVTTYLEYPYIPHPMEGFAKLLNEMGITDPYGADQDGYPWILGYRGPSLTELVGSRPQPIPACIEDQMMIKSPAELDLIRESVKWGNLAHTLLQRYTHPGITETEVSWRASMEATLSMLDAVGPVYRAQSPFANGAEAGYRGQIGRNASIPHALANNTTFKAGDVLVSGAGCPVWGYNSELERTMIIGTPSVEQTQMFDHMLALQETAFRSMHPGVTCSQVDQAVRVYYAENGLIQYWKHHVGHAIGLRYHEGPFLDLGDHTQLRPGMVFTVEPGLYIPEVGGFRHSDTVVITEDGVELMTYYPRDLESLTIPI